MVDVTLAHLLIAALSAEIEALSLAGFDVPAKDLANRILHLDDRKKHQALQKAIQWATEKAAGDEEDPNDLQQQLLQHKPFQQEVIASLLDGKMPDVPALAEHWSKELPQSAATLSQFFKYLLAALVMDEDWGPILDRYQRLRSQPDVQKAEMEKGLPVSERELVQQVIRTQIQVKGSNNLLVTGDNPTVVQQNIQNQIYVTEGSGKEKEEETRRILRETYLNRVFEATGMLSLAGIDRKAASEAETRLNLSAVYTALETTTIIPEIIPISGFAPVPYGRFRMSALEQINRYPRLVLMGDPGSGKSTFINFVALCMAGENLKRQDANLRLLTRPLPVEEENRQKVEEKPQLWEHGLLLPVRVILRDFAARGLPAIGEIATAEHLWRFIESELESAALSEFAALMKEELLSKGGLFLLDGLDEVPEAEQRRMQMAQAIADLSLTFGKCRIIVTCRTYAYQKQDWTLAGFDEAILAPFSAGQIRNFIERWYEHIAILRDLSLQDAKGRAELLKKAIFSSDRLRELAEQPLLLTLMASLHAWHGGSLPEKREELYADTVDLLLERWERPKEVRDAQGKALVRQPSLAEWLKVDRQQVRGLLNELAYQAHTQQSEPAGTADITEDALVGGLMRLSANPDVNPARLVEYLSQRAGLLLPRGIGVYTFPHRTFQEYLAACYLTDHGFPEKIAELACEDLNRWREVALLAGAKAARGTAFATWSLVDALCDEEIQQNQVRQATQLRGALLAGEVLAETANLSQLSKSNQAKLERVRRGLVHIIQQGEFPMRERVGVGNTLARLGDPRPAAMTLEGMAFCRVPAGKFNMGSQKKVDAYAKDNEKPHMVDLPEYYLSKFPVTQAQYAVFVVEDGYLDERWWQEARQAQVWSADQGVKGRFYDQPSLAPVYNDEPFNLANHPVVGVTWYEALAFTRWLTDRWQGMGLLPDQWEVSLPSEAEWEKAARGGWEIPDQAMITPAAQGFKTAQSLVSLIKNPAAWRVYPWEGEFNAEKVNLEENGFGTTCAVGCFPGGRSPYGVEELSGNVWEWTRSLYWAGDGRENLAANIDTSRVIRGGNLIFDMANCRCAYRFCVYPDFIFWRGGFRVAVVLPLALDSVYSESLGL